MEHFGELGMMAHPVAVAADVDNVAVMEPFLLSSDRLLPDASQRVAAPPGVFTISG